jgi:PhnB protein
MVKAKKKKVVAAKKKKLANVKKATTKKTVKKSTVKKGAVKKKTAGKSAAKKKITIRSKKVSAVPKGYNSVTPCLVVSDGVSAIEFYKNAFGAKEVMRMERPGGKIGRAELRIGDARIMLSDACPEMDARSPESYGGSPVDIHLYIKNVDEVVARAISAGASLLRPIANMYYGDRTGLVADPYGHKWFVSTHIEDVSPAQIKKRAAALFDNDK